MLTKYLRSGAVAVALGTVAGSVCFAQAISGDLLGTCFDPSHASISGVQVVAVEETTNVRYVVKTGAAGEYHFVNLPVGRYDISVTAPGFADLRTNGVEIKLNQPSTVDLKMSLGEANSTVEVTEASVAIDTTTAQISTTFQPQVINDLPLASVGSGVLNLSLMNAGVQMTGGLGLGGGPSVSGQRPYNNNFTIEGVDNNNKSVHTPLVTVPNDAIAEFSVLQNQFSPEFGHSSGGQFNTVVKSGTNQFHGRAYEYFQNRNLNAIDYSNARQGLTENPRLDNNRFGGQVGGPIVRDRLFFFQNVEYNPVGQASGGSNLEAPTVAGYATLNALSGLSKNNLAVLQKYLPAASSSSSTIAVTDSSGNAVNIPVGNVSVLAPSYINSLTSTTATDYTISPKDSLRVRYIYFKQDQPNTTPLPAFFGTASTRAHLINISEYHTFSPSLTNELRFGFNRYANVDTYTSPSFAGLDTFPTIVLNDLSVNMGPGTPSFTIQNTYQLVDNVIWTVGKHDLRFGIEGRKVISPQDFVQRSQGDYEYNTTNLYLHDESPDSLGERSVGVPVYYGDQVAVYGYAHDNWRVSPQVALSFGARYEYTTVSYSERLQALNSIASVPGLISFDKPTAPKLNFAPRGGITIQPTNSADFVIRAGIGMAYDVLYDNIGITTLPPQLSRTEDTDPSTQTPNFLANGGLPPGSGQLTVYNQADARANTSAAIVNHQLYPYSLNYNLGVSKSFAKDYQLEVRYVGTRGAHLNYQYRINRQASVTPTNFLPVLTGNYSQAQLDSMKTLAQVEAAVPSFKPAYAAAGFGSANLTIYEPFAGSNYNGLQTQLNKRISGGLQFQASYTWSKNLDNATSDFDGNDLDPRRLEDSNNPAASYALSTLDRRHRFTLGGSYDLPQFKHSSNWFLKNILGNYQVAPFYQIESPEHATVQSGVDVNLNGDAAGDRVIYNPNGVKNTGSGLTALKNSAGAVVAYQAVNPNAQYIIGAPGVITNIGRNTLPIPNIDNLDVTVTKGINFHERYRLQISAQAYNSLNHAQFVPGNLNDVASKSGFVGDVLHPGTATFLQWNSVFNSNSRTLQLVGKFSF